MPPNLHIALLLYACRKTYTSFYKIMIIMIEPKKKDFDNWDEVFFRLYGSFTFYINTNAKYEA